MEAQTSGFVPIAFDSFTSASEIIIDGKNGILVSPFNKKEYIYKLQELISNGTLRNTLSNNAKEHVKSFSHNIIAKMARTFQ